MKKIPNPFSWYPRDFWYWPDHDEKLLQVIHQVHDLDQVLPLIPNKRVCIQAGGACGVWPAYLSLHFDEVVTFEPDDDNYKCMKLNSIVSNFIISNCPLTDSHERFSIVRDAQERTNSGAGYLAANEYGHKGVIVDLMFLEECDFICLDIEGHEHQAIIGAKETIERCNPVIMIEEKPLPHLKPGEHLKARQYLESIGYKEVLKVNRDVVFKR